VKRLPLATLVVAPEHVEAFKALSNPGRLDVFFTLVKARKEMAVGEILDALGIPGPTLSHHLEQLRRAGLLQARRQERFIYYSVGPMVSDLVRLLTACC
jgi:ArsR family transcriptional regulator